ncbi:MAG: HD domain-containing protein [Candidatus Methylomirabilales bacterium]
MSLALLLRALDFAAAKHRNQRRKDAGASPYINHLIDVASLLAHVGKVEDVVTLAAAALHDTLEDTATTPAELEEAFGPEIRRIVEEVSDDKRLSRAERRRVQVAGAAERSPRARLVMLADKISNVRDVTRRPPPAWTPEGTGRYFDWTAEVVGRIRGTNAPLEACYDDVLREARAALAARASGQRPAVSDPPARP